jgi:RimJ/RimL family protein N-acetyltransferase
MNLQTARLLLRNLKESDLRDFLEYRSDPEVCRFQGYEPFTEEQGRKYIANLKERKFGAAGKWIQLGIELKGENKLVGDIGLKPDAGEPRIAEFGISLSRQYQGNGYAKEALTEVFDFLFSQSGIHRIIGIVDVENSGVIRLVEKLNFRREAAFVASFCDKGIWRDEYLYAMLASDWKSNLK